jgi:hypothetical protein
MIPIFILLSFLDPATVKLQIYSMGCGLALQISEVMEIKLVSYNITLCLCIIAIGKDVSSGLIEAERHRTVGVVGTIFLYHVVSF